ncbi:Hypothetical protein A7982_03231 [Minicystis rosea]|nr:Hypothetical protein A7982_03231 [Minicystis rosea]
MIPTLVVSCMAVLVMSVIVSSLHHRPEEIAGRHAKAYPRHPIRQFPDAQAGRIVGIALRREPLLRSPLTARDCIAYVVRVYERIEAKNEWKLILDVAEATTFALRDETGLAEIRARDGRMALTVDHFSQSGTLSRAPRQHEVFLQSHELTSLDTTLKYEEAILTEGERVSVYGFGQHEAGSESESGKAIGYREQPQRLVMAPSAEKKLFISNMPSTFE